MTKAQEVFEKVEALVAAGTPKVEAFKQLAEEYGQPVNSIRGSYYQHSKAKNGESGTRPRHRETTLEAAVASAQAALERAIENIDLELIAAKTRLDEAKLEYDALKASAADRKTAISAKLEALK